MKVIITLEANVKSDFYLPAFTGIIEGIMHSIKIIKAQYKVIGDTPTQKGKE